MMVRLVKTKLNKYTRKVFKGAKRIEPKIIKTILTRSVDIQDKNNRLKVIYRINYSSDNKFSVLHT